MNFYEKSTEKGYVYYSDGAFGTIEIYSPERLVGDKGEVDYLDDVYWAIEEVARKNSSQTIEGDVAETEITYKIEKASPWSDIEEDAVNK